MSLTKIMFAYAGHYALDDTPQSAADAWAALTGQPIPATGYFLARVEPGATIDANGNIQPSNYEPMPHQ